MTWSSNAEIDISDYNIYRYILYEQGWEYLATTRNSNYTDESQEYCTPGSQCLSHNIYYRVTAVDYSQQESVPSDSVMANVEGANPNKGIPVEIVQEKPEQYQLCSNYPNPFNPTTCINYQIKDKGFVSLKVYDMLGREVATLVNENQDPGAYAILFNAGNLPSGVYIYSLRANDFIQNNKMTLMK